MLNRPLLNDQHNSPVITITALPSGLKLAHRLESSEVEYFGASIDVGSRDDPEGLMGLAHFVEHVIFKGTQRRRSWHIVNRMESVGGELNAYTTKENTVVYSVFPSGNFNRAAELIADLLCNSSFPAAELTRERDVVADEIAQYRDIPSEAVFDDFEDLIFAGSQLGHNILGSAEDLARFTPEVCVDYCRRNFTADNMVIFYAGPLGVDKVAKIIDGYFAPLAGRSSQRQLRLPPGPVGVFEQTCRLYNHQANTVMGLRIGSLTDPDRWANALLCNIIGGPGMNSLLNLELRERRGLVYAADSTTSLMTDTGLFTIYWGCDPDDNARCRRLALNIIDRIASGSLSDRFVDKARKQYIGQLTLSADNRENSIMSMARSALYYGRFLTRQQVIDNIMSVDAAKLQQVASSMLCRGLSSLTLV